MEAVRSGGDLMNIGGNEKYSKDIVCPDGCVIFRLTAKNLGNENFHKGSFLICESKRLGFENAFIDCKIIKTLAIFYQFGII